MSYRLLPSAIRLVLQTADELQVKLPAVIRDDLDSHMALINNVAETSFAGQSIAQAVNEAVLAGNDPVDDPAVQAAFIRDRVCELQNVGALNSAALDMLHASVRPALDAIFDAFKPAFDTAGTQLTEAHAVFVSNGLTEMDDTQIASSGIDVAQANLDARRSIETMRRIRNVLDAVEAALGKIGSGNGVSRAAMTIDPGDTPATEMRRFLGAITPWEALNAGYTISLASPTEQRARVARALAADEAADVALDQKRKDSIKQQYGSLRS